jgi:hypothetical protein
MSGAARKGSPNFCRGREASLLNKRNYLYFYHFKLILKSKTFIYHSLSFFRELLSFLDINPDLLPTE